MVKHFNAAVLESGLPIRGIIQISMDGPNVNWKSYKLIKEKLSEEFDDTKLTNIGSCGLHIIHNSLEVGLQHLDGIYPLFCPVFFICSRTLLVEERITQE